MERKRGIGFEIPNEYGDYLSKILDKVGVGNYYWMINEEEIYVKCEHSKQDVPMFNSDVVNGEKFKAAIELPSYYVLFATLCAFDNEKDQSEFHNYYDFLNSKCKLAVIIVDAVFVDIYVKDEKTTRIIENNAIKNGFLNIHYITDDNDLKEHF